MAEQPLSVLFLCTGNSARSILAEAILNRLGQGRFRAFSAGSQPKGEVNPHAVALLRQFDYDTSGLRSKPWSEFAQADAPALDVIITVCDSAAGEACPIWPGRPATAHWGIADPAAVQGSPAEMAQAFTQAYRLLAKRIALLAALPVSTLDAAALQARLKEIGRIEGATAMTQQG